MRIFLTGFMGSGKSFWGKKLASRYRLPHFDLDTEIEQRTQQSISDIFISMGEDAFREIESNCLQDCISNHPHFVMSTGGGTPCYRQNNEWMKQSGIVVYLQTESAALYQRLQHDNKHRPLIAHLLEDELLSYIQKTLQQRQATYETAHHIVDTKSANESIFDTLLQLHV